MYELLINGGLMSETLTAEEIYDKFIEAIESVELKFIGVTTNEEDIPDIEDEDR